MTAETERRPLRGFRLSASESWVSLPVDPTPPPGWEEQAAAQLVGADDLARDAFVRELRTVHPSLVEQSHLAVAVWVPDAATGAIAGGLSLDLLVGDPGDVVGRAAYRTMLEPDRRKGLKVYERVIEEVDVPAGPALVVREVLGRRTGIVSLARVLEESCTYTVFPPECTDAVALTCVTPLLDLGDAMAEQAHAAAESLVVLVRDQP